MKKIFMTLLTLAVFCTACVQEIPSPRLEKSSIAVSCILSNTDVQRLSLTYSKSMEGGRFFEEVEQATATLYEEGNKVGVFVKSKYGEWELKYHPKEGKRYRLQVEVPGSPVLSATTTMPAAVAVLRNGTTHNNRTKLFTQQAQSAPIWMFCMQSAFKDPLYAVQPPQLAEDTQAQLFQQTGTDHKNADRFNQEGTTADFDFQYGNLLSYKYYVRIAPDNGISNQNPYPFQVQHPSSEASFVVFRSVSEEYDRYLKSIIEKMTFYESEADPVQWFDESVIYSNIENGLGIFGAYRQKAFYYNNTVTTLP